MSKLFFFSSHKRNEAGEKLVKGAIKYARIFLYIKIFFYVQLWHTVYFVAWQHSLKVLKLNNKGKIC